MVVEELTGTMAPELVERYIERDRETWTRFLREQPGFVAKQVWTDPLKPGTVNIIVWWDCLASWQRITPEDCAAIDQQMGDLVVPLTCRAFDVADATSSGQPPFR